MILKRLMLLLLLAASLLLPVSTGAQEAGEAVITSPAENDPLFGLVTITGSATHPSLFAGYTLEFSSVQTPDLWVSIQPRVSQQVSNNILGQWDTVQTQVPDGIYQIRLQVFLTDETVQTVVVRNLQLVNSTPTLLPSVAPIVPAATLPGLPTPGPSPTSLINQPPTVTPAPTFEQPAPITVVSNPTSGDSLFNFGAVQTAFCNGIYLSGAFFALVVGYLVVRRQVSPYTRRLWWQIRNELQDDQRDY